LPQGSPTDSVRWSPYYGIISVIKKHYSTDDLEMKPPLITNMMQRKDISKYIWSLPLGYRNYIMHCFLFPFCVITCYLEVYDVEVAM
jgi:hypothetical protein